MAKILVVDDEEGMREFLKIMLSQRGYDVAGASTADEAFSILKEGGIDLLILDIKMEPLDGLSILKEARKLIPEIPTIMISAYASPETAIEAMKEGAYDYLPKPFNIEEMCLVIEEALKKRKQKYLEATEDIQEEDEFTLHFSLLIGESPQMKKVYDLIEKVSQVDSNVLIRGESGTGKELVARAIHNLSRRRDYPFVSVNCAGVPDSLIESELFGYKKGAFTGADQDKKGLVEFAQKGTLFLDEVGELSPLIQVKLLRVIQEKTIRRLGDTEDRHVDVRIIAATHRNLEDMVVKGTFREDLYYRLNVIPITLPPLRERGKDIELLAKFFLKKYSRKLGKRIHKISSYAMDILRSYQFPGNVRELENIIERGVALEQTRIILPDSLIIASHKFKKQFPSTVSLDYLPELPPDGMNLDKFLEEVEKHYIIEALLRAKGNKQRAGELLGINLRSIRYRISKYGLEQFATAENNKD